MRMEEETHILEIHLISAQGLKAPSANLRRMQTYALAWVDSSAKLRTGVDRFGGENPTWNDKFLFRISPDFISSETSGVTFELYAVACIKDVLVGSVRFLLSSCPTAVKASAETPAFIAAQIQRPSGRFHGVLNIGAAVYKATKLDRAMMNGVSATSFRDMMEKKENLLRRHRRLSDIGSKRSIHIHRSSSSSSSSSSSNSSIISSSAAVDKDEGKKEVGSDGGGGGLLCGLVMQRRFSFCPLDQNMMRIAEWAESLEKKKKKKNHQQ
ncbi:PREDICTED: uncharacterized protein LOC109156029 [Ipomoea nil]|uniref:uncharacterized protein LOC109156029 n=1 Tax=Ipomoea nil TaxID=35883 RepID=UPI000900CC56|nr:PREDICTED: uncharacterized protein LOC109156029 [Ipomoea nil]